MNGPGVSPEDAGLSPEDAGLPPEDAGLPPEERRDSELEMENEK